MNLSFKIRYSYRPFLCCFYLLFINCLHAQTRSFGKGAEQSNGLKAGAAAIKITPPVGSIMGMSYGLTVSEGVHDDIYAEALVLEQGDVKSAFITFDFVSLPYTFVERTKKLIAERAGIPGKNIIMIAKHSHAGPQMNPLFWDAVGGLPKQKSEEYVKKLPAMIAEGVQLAKSRIQPVHVFVGTIKENTVNFNRRYLLKDGSVQMNPERMNPDIVRAVGPVDPDVSIVLFKSLDSKPVAIIVNYALHVAVVGGNRFSADFPGTISALLAKVYGEEMVTIYTNGTSGNINHVDVTRKNQLSGYEESERIGTILAGDVMKAIPSLQPIDVNSIQIRTETVELPIQAVQPDKVKWAQEVISRFGKPSPPPFFDIVRAWKILDLAALKGGVQSRITTTIPLTKDGKALESEVQVLALGNKLALVGFPGDAFVELGLGIKLNSPFPFTIVNEQSGNGTLSYVPNSKAFPEGAYEVISARFAPGGGELLVDAAIRILINIFPHTQIK